MNTKKEIYNYKREDLAMSFLLFSYFGISGKEDKDSILKKLIQRAYRDAASHVLSVKEEVKEEKKETAIQYIVDAIEALNNTQRSYEESEACHKSYDCWHKKLCRKLVEEYNGCCSDKYNFTHGVAQKWVNMTVKYIYIICFLDFAYEENEGLAEFTEAYENLLYTHIKSFHVPIDSYVLKAAKKELGVKPLKTAWSKIDTYYKYLEYQNTIRKALFNDYTAMNTSSYTPIDWEAEAWLKVAKSN